MTDTKDTMRPVLERAINGDMNAEQDVICYIRDNFMKRRVGRFLHKNRQVDDEDIKQEFLIGVAMNIRNVRMDIGDPFEYLMSCGIYRVRSYMRKQIMTNTIQVCNECGNITRLNRVDGNYICKKCGSSNITTSELDDHNEIIFETMQSDDIFEEETLSQSIVDKFEETLDRDTNVYNLFKLLTNGINRDNPEVRNYIKEIARMWGGCSEQNVVQAMQKLQKKIIKFADDNHMHIKGYNFVIDEGGYDVK